MDAWLLAKNGVEDDLCRGSRAALSRVHGEDKARLCLILKLGGWYYFSVDHGTPEPLRRKALEDRIANLNRRIPREQS